MGIKNQALMQGKVLGAGVAVITSGMVLLCKRTDGQGWCLPAGKVEEGEKFTETAKRELFEETKLKAETIELIGYVDSECMIHNELKKTFSYIFVCEEHTSDNTSCRPNDEIEAFKFINIKSSLDEFIANNKMFPPTLKSLELVKLWYNNQYVTKRVKVSAVKNTNNYFVRLPSGTRVIIDKVDFEALFTPRP